MKTTLASRIYRSIVEDYVDSGVLKDGDQLPSVRELKQRYGCSITTIAHSLSMLEGEGLVEKRHGTGCFLTGRPSLAKPREQLVIASVMPFYNQKELPFRLFTGAERACHRYGCQLMVATDYRDYEGEHAQVKRMVKAGCQAIVLYPVSRVWGQQYSDYLNREYLDVPIILVDTAFPEQQRSQVLFDNHNLGYEMTDLLLGEGHDRIAFMQPAEVGGGFAVRSSKERYLGHLACLNDHDLKPRPGDLWGMALESGQPARDFADQLREHLRAWKRQTERPSGLIAIDDNFAFLTLSLAHELDIEVPHDLRVVGFDNLRPWGLSGQLPGTDFPTSDPDFRLAGERAVELAIRHVHGKVERPVVYMLPVPIVVREAVSGMAVPL